MSRWPFFWGLACLVLYLPRDGGAQDSQQAMAQDAMASSGIAMTQGFNFGNSALKESKGRNLQTTSRVNQNFLRRGTRADLERIAIERLMGRRGKDDWLLAGSDAWLERRAKLDREAMELRERIAIADACAKDFLLEECKSPTPPLSTPPCARVAYGVHSRICVLQPQGRRTLAASFTVGSGFRVRAAMMACTTEMRPVLIVVGRASRARRAMT